VSKPMNEDASASSASASASAWGSLICRLLRVQRYGFKVVVDAASSTPAVRNVGSSAAPETCDVGSNSRDYYAPLLAMRLDALVPSGVSASAADISAGAYLLLSVEICSVDLPIQSVLPSGTRCRVRHVDADGDFWVVVPLCGGAGLCLRAESACHCQVLLR
jgi:hypothetical protein